MGKNDGSSSKPDSRAPPGLIKMITEHADWIDITLMLFGTGGCVANGLSMSLVMLVVSRMTNGYASFSSITPSDINQYALIYMYIAVVVASGAFIQGFCWGHTAERQASRMRIKYLKAVLRQEIGYFDKSLEASRVVTNISTDISINIQGVLSEKIPDFIANLCMFTTAELTAVYLCWRLAIVALPAMFLLIIPGVVYGNLLSKNEEKLQEAYAVAGGIAEQAFSSIKTVHSYVGEEKMVKKFSNALIPTLTLGIKQGLLKGMVFGSFGIIFAIFAFMSWYGSILVINNGAKGGDILSAGTCIVYGGFGLGASLMNIKHFAEARISASLVNEIIDRVPSIDSTNEHGKTIPIVKGALEFKNIDFAYPSRPESLVLKNFNLKIKNGQTVGLVGQSGAGKSTVINLLERFYDPIGGEILLDGVNIKTLQLKWLRSQMGLVSQEPILFATTIKENILFGKEGATSDEIMRAAKKSNAHNFIMQLPNGYDTLVGELGTHMSGGQKQRISIARALLRKPKILLLDEATSSLDSHSEKAVQEALTRASIGKTTIVIAHGLSIVHDADLIVVIKSGEVIESGSHEELIRNTNGPYSIMVNVQKSMFVKGRSLPLSEQIKSRTVPYPETKEKTENRKKLTKSRFKEVTNQQSDEEYNHPSWWQLMQMTTPEWKSTLMGTIAALISGLVQPLVALFQAVMLSIFFLKDQDEIKSQTRNVCYAFMTVSVSAIISSVIQHYYFGIMGENLTKRIRLAIFEKIMAFEIEWFDQDDNSTGALCSRLSSDTLMVRNLVADRLAFFAQSISASILAIVWGMFLSWRLASVAITLQLFVIGSFYVKLVMTRNMSKKVFVARNKSSGIASEAVSNHRIITAYYSQDQVMRLYHATQKGPKKESKKQPLISGMALFTRQFVTTMNICILYWYGGKLLYNGEITYKHLFQTFYIVVTAGILIAEAGSMTGDISVGTNALRSLFKVLNRSGKMETGPLKDNALNPKKINGKIELKEVEFTYLTRPTKMVLRGLSLKIKAGEVAALVGASGSGKSTIIGMIQRFYDPKKGSVEVDGVDIKRYNLKALRSFIAWVGQEPTLFAGTVKENIAYGKENATEAEIIQAASHANIHKFIRNLIQVISLSDFMSSSMKDGYNTVCGERGTQLSGGQKQRIAIARAILKNPAILLLDEATSALDVRSEIIVQDALEKTMVGRTCVIIAHRLSTIQRSNKILVIDNGIVVEEGSHDYLLAKREKSAYFSLFNLHQQSYTSNKEDPS
ncbi:P-glycoprotein 16 [Artemisia annua]|uniref:p-glycoprotein 16 n=1 Tax=Artemisia annua TaxID=35608 RepID=A0A2U1NW14_ARTAN|nr:P-glycoprotein 16 [Artemisia annua]